jgi:hypothetical protein
MVFNTTFNNISVISWQSVYWCMRRGRHHQVVGFTTTCAISAITTKVVNLNPAHGEMYLIQFLCDKVYQ